ncbi:hypothetical protein ACWIUD_04125 [Helicobacter sp. 23-1044]
MDCHDSASQNLAMTKYYILHINLARKYREWSSWVVPKNSSEDRTWESIEREFFKLPRNPPRDKRTLKNPRYSESLPYTDYLSYIPGGAL